MNVVTTGTDGVSDGGCPVHYLGHHEAGIRVHQEKAAVSKDCTSYVPQRWVC